MLSASISKPCVGAPEDRIRSARSWYSAFLLVLSSCTSDAITPKAALVLEKIQTAPIANIGILTGASVDSAGEVVVWGSSGSLFALTRGSHLLKAIQRPTTSRWRTVTVRPGTSGRAYAALDSQTLRTVHDSSTMASYRLQGRLRAVTANANELIFVTSDSAGGIDINAAAWEHESSFATHIDLKETALANRLAPFSVTRFGTTLALAGAADSLIVYCTETPSSQVNRQANSLKYTGDEKQNHVPLWKVASMVSLDSGFLIAIADLRSPRRRIARYDSNCKQVTDSEVPDGFVPAATSPSGALLVGTRALNGGEVVVMKWRWQAAK